MSLSIRAAIVTAAIASTLISSPTDAADPNLDLPFFYMIFNQTSKQAVAKGSDGNVIRYDFDQNAREQHWLFAPAGGDRWYVINSQNGEYLSIEGQGNARTYPYKSGDKAQTFRIEHSGGRIRLRESTRDEYVAVGSGVDRNVFRWGRATDGSQEFILVAVPMVENLKTEFVKKPKINKPTPGADPENVLSFANMSNLPAEMNKQLVSEELISAAAVLDPTYGPTGRIQQAIDSPFYIISRHRYYKRGQLGQYPQALKIKNRTGIESEKFRSAGFSLGVEAKQETKAGVEVKKVKLEASRSITLRAAYEELETFSQKAQTMTEVDLEVPAEDLGFPYRWAHYQLVDKYTISKMVGSKRVTVTDWEVFTPGILTSKKKS